ncbi:MAG: lipase family protein [Candidatus Amoebophilus sp.]
MVIPREYESQIQRVYQGCNIQTLRLLEQDDTTSCGAYTIENLLLALENNNSPSQITNHQIRDIHLDALRNYNQRFYEGFYVRQRDNIRTNAGIAEQLRYHGPSEQAESEDSSNGNSVRVCDEFLQLPLVSRCRNGLNTVPTFEISPSFSDIIIPLMRLSHLAYLIRRNKDVNIRYKISEDNHWQDPLIIGGKTGLLLEPYPISFKDDPVLITYNTKKNIIAIMFRGSGGMGDWMTNLYGSKDKATNHGFNFEGDYHLGFLTKYKACKPHLEKGLESIMSKLNSQQLSKLQFIVSGHSQGGALSTIASVDLCSDFLKRKYGESFFNPKRNLLYGWYVSSPKVTDTSVVNSIVGKNNIIFQTVLMDFASRVGFEKFIPNTLGKIGGYIDTIIGNVPADKRTPTFIEKKATQLGEYINYVPTETPGHLSIDYTLDALVLGYQLSLKNIYDSYYEQGDWPIGLMFSLCFPSLGDWFNLATAAVAPTHYGTSVHGTGGYFDLQMVLHNSLQQNLIKGYYYGLYQELPKDLEKQRLESSRPARIAKEIATHMEDTTFNLRKDAAFRSIATFLSSSSPLAKALLAFQGLKMSYSIYSVYNMWKDDEKRRIRDNANDDKGVIVESSTTAL